MEAISRPKSCVRRWSYKGAGVSVSQGSCVYVYLAFSLFCPFGLGMRTRVLELWRRRRRLLRSTERKQYFGRFSFPRVLIVDARSFQAFAAIVDYVTNLASMSCYYRPDARQDEFRQSQAALLWISKVRGYDHVCSRWSTRKKKNTHIPVMK